MTHPNVFKINEGSFSEQTFFPAIPVAFIYMTIANTNNFKQVSASYQFTI